MKRLDLVQLTLIIVGIFSAFFFINHIPRFFMYLFSWFSDGLRGGYLMDGFIENILQLTMYLILSIYTIKNSRHFAEWICDKALLNSQVNFALDKTELLFVLFVGLGIYGLITNLPALLVNGYIHIKDSNSNFSDTEFNSQRNGNIIIQLCIVLLFFTLVYYSKVFADFFAGKINNTEPEDDIASKTD